ncbi:hypothetical protein C8R42DRAFT_722394 [Lentinula raphanica]|nr:hypothetical protein C8R42DRAFT_722394 [Lentinula raphanica]
MKCQRLLAGKGVKKDGFYLQDRASSWESLPPGPEPNSVAQDIRDNVPKLTKKGTLFRASQSLVCGGCSQSTGPMSKTDIQSWISSAGKFDDDSNGASGLSWQRDRVMKDWSSSMMAAQSILLESRTSARILFLHNELLPLAKHGGLITT